MPPPQCPECGRFLATAFVETIKSEASPCPGCGTELSLADEDGEAGGDAAAPEEAPPVPPPAATLPAEDTEEGPAVPPPAATLPDVEPEPETSVRPPDLQAERDPLAGWDQAPTISPPDHEPDPAVIAGGAGAGLLLGLLLGGREHRGLGALLGAVLGAVVASLRR